MNLVIRILLKIMILNLSSNVAHSYAWNQNKGKIYTEQKGIWSQDTNTILIDENQLDEALNLKLLSKKTLVESYIEYGLKDNLTLVSNLSFADIKDRLKFNFKNKYHDIDDSYNISYKKADLMFCVVKNVGKNSSVTALIIDLYPGQYYFSKFGNTYVSLKAGLGCGLAHGSSFVFNQKDFFHEIYSGLKYFPKIKSIEPFFRFKIGCNLTDKWQISAETSIDLYSKSYTYLPYINTIKEGIDQLESYNTELYKNYLEYYKIRVARSHNIRLQLGVSRKVSKKRDISAQIFFNPLKMKRNTGIIVSIIQKFN